MSAHGKGAYGFRLVFDGEAPPTTDLVDLDETVPAVTYRWCHASPLRDIEEVTDDAVRLATRGSGSICVRRNPPSVWVATAESLPAEAFVHPVFAVPASMLARWRGDMTLHAGAFEHSGGAWALVGRREAGKSTMLAALATRGTPVVVDDFLTVDRDQVWAGPNCVDLRPASAPQFPAARPLGHVGGRMRFRVSTPPSLPRLPLRGFFLLEWWDEPRVDVSPMPATDVLRLMVSQEYIALMGRPSSERILDIAARPAWRVRRPRSWDATDEAVASILETADQH